jgi:dolichol-phosphate mannosyltransferase
MPSSSPRLDVVVPIFDEEELFPELVRRLAAALDSIGGVEWRVILVDDGSRDRSLELALAAHARDPRFTVVELSRNFGHQSALTAGLAHTDADAVILIDGDLQDPPELCGELVAAWRAGGEVVLAVRTARAETGLRGFLLRAFHRVFAWLSDFPIQTDSGIFCLLDRAAVAELKGLREAHRFLPGLQSWIGFKRATVTYERSERAAGAPKQTFRRLVRYALDAVFGFSYKPLRLMTLAGIAISGVGFLLALFFVIWRLTGNEHAEMGFTTLVTLVLFLGGVQLIAIGLLGEYLGRIYDEVKQRPLFIVRERHGVGAPEER